MNKFDVILPAGGRIDGEFAEKAGVTVKALIQFDGETILERTIKALNATGKVGNTVVIGPEEVRNAAKGLATHTLEEGSTGPENMYRGLELLVKNNPGVEKVMIATTDMPFLTPEIMNRFIDMCPADADISMPLIDQAAYDTRFPDSGATFVPLRDGTWTTGGAFIVGVKAFQRIRPAIDSVFAQRKSKVGMAKLLGPVFVFKMLMKRLTVPDVEAKIVSLLGCTGKAVVNAPTELAYDIDDLHDYEYALTRLA